MEKDGRWRFPLWVSFGVFILVSASILIVEALVGVGVMIAMTEAGIPSQIMLPVLVLAMIVVACVLSQMIYFGLRESRVEYDGEHCLSCGYNLTGNVSGVCPECGEPLPRKE